MHITVLTVKNILPGDILGFLGSGLESFIINVGTYGIPGNGLSHVGIAAEYDGRTILFESTTLNDRPCYIQNKLVKGVQAHPIEYRIETYKGKIWHYPLRMKLRGYEKVKLTHYLLTQLGVAYDYAGAGRAGGKLIAHLEGLLRKENLSNLFCSELCAAAHREIERFDTLNASEWNPNSFTREERRRGILVKPVRFK